MNAATLAPDLAQSASRQALYRFTAVCLADPRAGAWPELADPSARRLVDEAAAYLREESAAKPDKLGRGELPLSVLNPAAVFAALPERYEAFNSLYESTFGLLVSGACPPYETEYIHSKLEFQRAQTLADVAGFYAAFGFQLSRAHPERPDHLATQLEFMASLVALERMALQDDSDAGRQRAAVCREAQQRFLAEHIAWWAPTLARLLSLHAAGTFYEAVATFLAALVPAERALLGVPAVAAVVQPMAIERPEECHGCLLHP